MKSFRDYISEEVVPTALVKDGSIDLEKEEVRASINMALAKVTSDSSITPYIALNRISKALSYFHIILPKRVYLEGAKGIEVHELRQFGQKMGMTDAGEFVNEVPGKYYLFIQYGMNTPMNSGGQYAYPTMGGTFRVTARVVDPVELDRLVSMAELSLAEECNAETQQAKAKMMAPKEPMKDLDVDGSPSTDADVAISQRKKDKKLSAGSLDEASMEKLMRYRRGAEQELGDIKHFKKHPGQYPAATSDDRKGAERREKTREKGIKLAHKKMTGKAKVGASAPKHPYMEETVEEGRMPASVIKHKQKLANMTPEEKAKKFAGKSEEELKSMARRHGYGKDSNEYSKHVKEETDAADETNMAKTQLSALSSKASNLHSKMKGAKNLPAWVQSKIAVAKDGVTAVDDYMTHSNKKLDEKTLTPAETKKKEEIVKSMKKGLEGFKERYGKRAKSVMYATATKQAKKIAEKLEFDPSTEIPKNS